MKEARVFRERGRFHVRVNDQWSHNRSFDEARDILSGARLNAHRLLAEAVEVKDPITVEYRPGRRSWLVNGQPQPLAVVRYLLAERGCTRDQIAAILRAHKLFHQAA